jgi:hypothetical protein
MPVPPWWPVVRRRLRPRRVVLPLRRADVVWLRGRVPRRWVGREHRLVVRVRRRELADRLLTTRGTSKED